ncbi:MAG: hypothetical protein ACKPAE_08980, partial [Microcystis panniformis]
QVLGVGGWGFGVLVQFPHFPTSPIPHLPTSPPPHFPTSLLPHLPNSPIPQFIIHNSPINAKNPA